MLHVDPTAIAGTAPPAPPRGSRGALPFEEERARAYIAACRACGLVVFPWRAYRRDGTGRDVVGIFGEERDGPRDYSAGTGRLLKHPDGRADEDCRPGLIFEMLCDDFGVEPDDPDLCNKVNAVMAARAERRQVAS